MTTPAIFFRNDETFKLCWKSSYDFFGPIISAFVKTDGYYKAAEIFENHNSVEFLIQEIERLDKNE